MTNRATFVLQREPRTCTRCGFETFSLAEWRQHGWAHLKHDEATVDLALARARRRA